MSNKTITLHSTLHDYLLQHGLKETPVLNQLREFTKTVPGAQMQIAPEQGAFMAWMLRLINAKTVLEIGTFTGYSALVMADSLPIDGKLITCDVNEQTSKIAKQFWSQAGVAHKIEAKVGNALTTLDELSTSQYAGQFDWVFIDADKRNTQNYYEKSLTLLRKGGIIAVDNVFQNGKVADVEVDDASTVAMREFNQFVYNDDRVELTIVPIADGLTLLRKK